jgi:methylmalonyl-CoA/ethylmalonyl-CoA epimerase
MTASRIACPPLSRARIDPDRDVCHDTQNSHVRRSGRHLVLTRIDHVGIACRDLAERTAFYEATFGLAVVSREVHEEQGVREAMLHVAGAPAGSSYIQLLEPLGPDTPVGRFIARRGEGLHHVGYGVLNLEQALASLGAGGIQLIDKRPRHGSMGAAIAFLHPAGLGGVLTELVQAPPGVGGLFSTLQSGGSG